MSSIVEKAAERLRRQNGSAPRHSERPDYHVFEDESEPYEPEATVDDRGRVVIDRAALRRAGILPPEAMAPRIAREYQRIKRPILAAFERGSGAGQRNANRLMVTSAKSGDGKTFTSMNLALSLAQEMDYQVLLVDGDVARPSLSQSLGLRHKAGLMDLLANPQRVAGELAVATDVPNLSVLPAGKHSGQAVERLSSRRMESVVAELSEDTARIVIFDSSPLLATGESQALALNMAQILMVVRAGVTERRALESALSLLDPAPATKSLILNQSRQGFGDDYDGYYGIYGTDSEHGL